MIPDGRKHDAPLDPRVPAPWPDPLRPEETDLATRVRSRGRRATQLGRDPRVHDRGAGPVPGRVPADPAMTTLTFDPADLSELADEGVLMAANEAFFWPIGLALTWTRDDAGQASGLHVRQWSHVDGERERIALADDDEVGADRRRRFESWYARRVASMLPAERP